MMNPLRAGLWWPVVVTAVLAARPIPASAQPAVAAPVNDVLSFESGKQIWEAGCVSCHGADGSGQADSLRGFEVPDTFPDFRDCPTSTPESDIQWRAVITNGGPARGFSRIMPAFRDILTSEQISMVISHVRSLCTERAWPQGDLNLPRALVTEKAFPESETVVAGTINAQGAAGVGSTLIYERRIGATAMIEAIVPYAFSHDRGSWGAAFGDLALGYKQALAHSTKRGSIFSVGGELIAPTGNPEVGTGGESTVFEAYAAYGQLFRGLAFLQVHSGIELPAHPDKTPRAYYLRTAVGKTFATDNGHGRRWTPMMEAIGDRDLEAGAVTNWDVVPQIQIPLNKRMHVLASIGYRVPVNNTDGRQRQWLFYGLWDWMDGGLLQGW
jgi:mono/diheme cytochrome c family protein